MKEQLDSFLCQTRLPDELIVCDDCSTDATQRIIEEFAAASPFPVRLYVNETNLGSTGNFEKAIRLCAGDVIFLSDQDDVWLPERMAKFETVFESKSDVGLVFCDAELVDENLQPLDRRNWEMLGFTDKMQKKFLDGDSFSLLLYRNVISGCAMAFRARYRNLILPMPDNLQYVIHDYWIAILLSTICRIDLIDEPLVKYRQHAKQQVGASVVLVGGSVKPLLETLSLKDLSGRFEQTYSFVNLLERMESIRTRLLILEGKYYKSAIDDLTRHIVHLRSRTIIQNKHKWRLPIVVKELATLRYHRYSNGVSSAFKDLLFK